MGLGQELAQEGMRVCGVRPGVIEHRNPCARAASRAAPRALVPKMPMGRTGSVDEIAEAVLWLMSDAACYITGTTIDVSGGR